MLTFDRQRNATPSARRGINWIASSGGPGSWYEQAMCRANGNLERSPKAFPHNSAAQDTLLHRQTMLRSRCDCPFQRSQQRGATAGRERQKGVIAVNMIFLVSS